LKGQDMERLQRLLRLARLRGDRVAIAILETQLYDILSHNIPAKSNGVKWTEAELRMMWGDR